MRRETEAPSSSQQREQSWRGPWRLARSRRGPHPCFLLTPQLEEASGRNETGDVTGGAPEHVRRISQSDGTVLVCPAGSSRELSLGQPSRTRPSPPESLRRQGQPPRKPEPALRLQRGRLLTASTAACVPGRRALGNAILNGCSLRHPSLGGGTTNESPASCPSVKFQTAGCTDEARREDSPELAAGEAGDEESSGDREGSAPLAAERGHSAEAVAAPAGLRGAELGDHSLRVSGATSPS